MCLFSIEGKGTKMEISQIIKFEGPHNVLVWKHPEEDFNTTSQLIVHESQEAILFRNGEALDLFGPGRHTLETENIPFLRRLVSIPTGGESAFHCKVYFINKADSMDVLWGTSSPIPIQDPQYEIILPVRANGQFTVKVSNSRKFLIKVIGTTNGLDTDTLKSYFRGLLMTDIKDYIAEVMANEKISFLQVHSFLKEISQTIMQDIKPTFDEYGLDVPHFYVNSINVPENDPGYIKIREALAAAKEKELLAKGEKAAMDIIGYNYQQEKTFEVLNKAASNEGNSGNMMGASMGLGMGIPIGGAMGNMMGSALNTSFIPAQSEVLLCPHCQAKIPSDAKFCLKCGQKVEGSQLSTSEVICGSCNQRTPEGKFCIHCGQLLTNICPNCNAENPAGSKFCKECGANLGGVQNEEK